MTLPKTAVEGLWEIEMITRSFVSRNKTWQNRELNSG